MLNVSLFLQIALLRPFLNEIPPSLPCPRRTSPNSRRRWGGSRWSPSHHRYFFCHFSQPRRQRRHQPPPRPHRSLPWLLKSRILLSPPLRPPLRPPRNPRPSRRLRQLKPQVKIPSPVPIFLPYTYRPLRSMQPAFSILCTDVWLRLRHTEYCHVADRTDFIPQKPPKHSRQQCFFAMSNQPRVTRPPPHPPPQNVDLAQ